MSNSYASVVLGGEDRNAEYLGIFVAWLVSNSLISDALDAQSAKAIARLRLQDMTGAGFLTTVLHGELRPEHVSERAQPFVEAYFVSGHYRADYDATEFDGEDEWRHYDLISPKITAAWRKHQEPEKKPLLAKVLKFPGAR